MSLTKEYLMAEQERERRVPDDTFFAVRQVRKGQKEVLLLARITLVVVCLTSLFVLGAL